MKYLRLLRLPNLLIVALTQYAMRFFIVAPLLNGYGYTLQLPEWAFSLLVLATVSLTAAGYVINDYFDTRTDFINRPGTVVVGTSVTRRKAILLHTLLNIMGVMLGAYLAYYVGQLWLAAIFLFVTGVLWLYSTTYKRKFLIGNLIVALLTGMVPLLVMMFEAPLLINGFGEQNALSSVIRVVYYWVGAFGFFAFITSIIREIIKDVEDVKGDKAMGCTTLPVKWGRRGAAVLVASLVIFTMMALGVVYACLIPHLWVLIYFSIGLWLPFLLLMVLILRAKSAAAFTHASKLTKLVMLLGILFVLIAYYLIKNNLL